MGEKIRRTIAELDYGIAYTITYIDPDGHAKWYELWLDKEYTLYCLQTIFLLDGKPDEVGDTAGYTKSEIMRKLLEISEYNQFHIREWG